MLYKFDIFFKKTLNRGSVKVITYSQLLRNPSAFGVDETLEGAIGTLSLTDDGDEKGCSLSSLSARYRSQLVGRYNAEKFGKQFPLQFVFDNPVDNYSIRAEISDENDVLHPFTVQTLSIDGSMPLDLTNADFIVTLIPLDSNCVVSVAGGSVELCPGQLALVPASVKAVSLQGHGEVKSIKCI